MDATPLHRILKKLALNTTPGTGVPGGEDMKITDRVDAVSIPWGFPSRLPSSADFRVWPGR